MYAYVQMVNKYYQKIKEKLEKKHVKGTKIFPKKKKEKGKKRPEADIQIFLKKKKKNCQHYCDRNKNPSEEKKQKKLLFST